VDERKKLQHQLEDTFRTMAKKDNELATLDRACKMSMNQNKANNKFLGIAIILKNVNSARCNQ